jgi:hypothetical protein
MLQVRFSQKRFNELPKFTSENLKNMKNLRTSVLLKFISDIHRVRTIPENPVDVTNLFIKFSDVILGSDFDPFSDNLISECSWMLMWGRGVSKMAGNMLM